MPAKKQRGTPKRRPARKQVRRRSTALVQEPKVPVVQGAVVEERRIDDEGAMLGELGLVEIKFTKAEEAILAEAVDPSRVLILPTGAVYLPHAEYTRWFNRAFGRGGWSLVPVGRPAMASKTIVVPYILYIHGKPAAFAQGEQEFFDNNRGQSYGDALESTVASGLRRCAKRLGVGLELWDREWGARWADEYAVKVWVSQKEGPDKPQWRRRNDPPLPYEKGRGGRQERQEEEREPPARQEAPPTQHAHTEATITDAQRRRLVTIQKNSGRTEQEVLEWLQRAYHYKGTADVARSQYDRICKAVEASGDLPRGRA